MARWGVVLLVAAVLPVTAPVSGHATALQTPPATSSQAMPAGSAVASVAGGAGVGVLPVTVSASSLSGRVAAATRRAGALKVSVSGVPAGVRARVRVRGPGGYTKLVTGSATLRKLAPGRYRITAGPASTPSGSLTWTITPASVKVTNGKTARVSATAAFTPTPPPAVPPVSPPASPPPTVPPVSPPPSSPPPDVTPPGPVTGLTVGTRTASSIGLSWTNPTDPDLDQVIVRRAQGGTAPATPTAGSPVPLGSPKASSVTDAGLDPDTTYTYAVFTRDTTGNTNPTAVTVTTTTRPTPDTTPPAVPAGLNADPGDEQVRLSWDPVADPDLADYQIYKGPSASGPWTEVAGSPTTNTHLTVSGLTNATGYWFTLTARDTTGNTSAQATPVTATPTADTTPPAPVTGLTVTDRTADSLTLSWTNPADPDLAAVIVRRTTGDTPPASPTDGTPITLDTPKATSVTDTGLDKTTRYNYTLFTRDTKTNTNPTGVTITATTRDTGTPCSQPLTQDTTWTPDYRDVYTIDCQLTIPNGTTLTIKPGTILKLTSSASLHVADGGTLRVQGTAADPVVFTSWADDSTGGDSNGDGDATSPAAGDWAGINIVDGGTATFDHALIRYPGTAVTTRSTAVSIANTTVRNCQQDAVSVTRQDLDPDPLWQDGNTATGCGRTNGIYFGYGSLTLTGDTEIRTRSDWDAMFASNVYVPSQVTLTVPADRWMKFRNTNHHLFVENGGTLTAQGTAADPVVFTSWADDSTGGDTNNDGNASSPAAGDWAGINIVDGAVGSLNGATIRFASVALDVSSGAVASIRGSILDSTVGVRSAGFVDAVRVDWGDPSGPAPVGSGTPVQGTVTYVPWKGWKAPVPPTPAPVTQDPPDPTCKDVLVIGVRGSGESPQGPPPDYGFEKDPIGFGARSWDAYWGFQERLLELRPSATLRQVGVKYKALGVAHNPLKNDYVDSISEGMTQLEHTLDQEISRCQHDPEHIVLVGYSQGALAIHLALRDIPISQLDKISSVILIADPAKVRRSDENLYETTNKPAGSGVWDAEGIWHALYEDWDEADPYLDLTGPLPASITNRTVHLCHNWDEICATGMFGVVAAGENWLKQKVADGSTNIDAHTNYTTAELNWLGEQAAIYTASRLANP